MKQAKIIESSDKESDLNLICKFLVAALPKVIKGLTFIGTIALILVSGGIFDNVDCHH